MSYRLEIASIVAGVGLLAYLVRLGWRELGELEKLKLGLKSRR